MSVGLTGEEKGAFLMTHAAATSSHVILPDNARTGKEIFCLQDD